MNKSIYLLTALISIFSESPVWAFSVSPTVGVSPQYFSRTLGGLGKFKLGLQSKAGLGVVLDDDIGPDSEAFISLNTPVKLEGGSAGDILLGQIGIFPSMDVVIESKGGALVGQFLGSTHSTRKAGEVLGSLSFGKFTSSQSENKSNSCFLSCDLKSRSWNTKIESTTAAIAFGYAYSENSVLGATLAYSTFDLEGKIQKINNSIPSNVSENLKGSGSATSVSLNFEYIYGENKNWIFDTNVVFGQAKYQADSSSFSSLGVSLSYFYSLN